MPAINKSVLKPGAYHMINDSGFEPQRNNNFEVQICGLTNLTSMDSGIPIGDSSRASELITLSVATYSAPQINITPITVAYGNNKVKFAGVPEFPESSIVLNDFIGVNIERILSSWYKLVYNPKTELIGKAVDYKKWAYLIEYSPDYSVNRQWQLAGCWLSSLQLGEFNQEGGSVRQVTCTLQYDYALPLDPDNQKSLVSSR